MREENPIISEKFVPEGRVAEEFAAVRMHFLRRNGLVILSYLGN